MTQTDPRVRTAYLESRHAGGAYILWRAIRPNETVRPEGADRKLGAHDVAGRVLRAITAVSVKVRTATGLVRRWTRGLRKFRVTPELDWAGRPTISADVAERVIWPSGQLSY